MSMVWEDTMLSASAGKRLCGVKNGRVDAKSVERRRGGVEGREGKGGREGWMD